ncbi:MAG: DUF4142 domain-containing protein [Ferruginibacter sp.]
MKNVFVCSLVFAGFLFLSSCNDSTKTETDSKEVAEEQNEKKFDGNSLEEDANFVVTAADGGMMEVQLGQLAQRNGKSTKVKQLGKMMVDDHSKANSELKTLAASKNITIPDSLGESKREKFNDFMKKKGTDFDKAYAEFMVDDHKKDIDNFKKQAERGNDSALKAWATGKISTLEHHLHMAEETRDAVEGRTSKDSVNK